LRICPSRACACVERATIILTFAKAARERASAVGDGSASVRELIRSTEIAGPGTDDARSRHLDMDRLERLFMWMAGIGAIGLALVLIWMLAASG
jgi:hypothetical protein